MDIYKGYPYVRLPKETRQKERRGHTSGRTNG
jgi:hypothetical protein